MLLSTFEVTQCHYYLYVSVLSTVGHLGAVTWHGQGKSVGPSLQRWETGKPAREAVTESSWDSQGVGLKHLEGRKKDNLELSFIR